MNPRDGDVMHSHLKKLLASALIIGAVTCAVPADVHGPADPTTKRIDELIRRLGAPGYSQRRQAQQELRFGGQPALDQLLQAQYDSNSEISLAARQLLGQFAIRWVQPQDETIIGYVLRGYEKLALDVRIERGYWLAELEDGLGTSAVARIVRYEPSELLAKQVAIHFIELFDASDSLQIKALERAIPSTLSNTNRRPAAWLKTFYLDVVGPEENANLPVWNTFAQDERELVSGPRSDQHVAAALTQWYATLAMKKNQTNLAKEALLSIAKLRKGNSAEILQTCHWLLDHNQVDLFDEFVNHLDEQDSQGPRFAYCLAETLLKRGDTAAAEQAAQQAFMLTDDAEKYFDPVATTNERFLSAVTLERRGNTDWCMREYRRIMDQPVQHWIMADRRERAIRLLAELLHDRSRDQEAADTLAKLVEDTNKIVFAENDLDEDTASLMSRMYYFRSEQYRQEANREKQVEFLRKAIQADATDADVLIAMYRLPRADDEWISGTKRDIEQAVQIFNGKLDRLRRAGVVPNRYEIATQLNQVAWLVGNTEGDQQQAIQQSRQSLELRPQSAGSLDTLGRTYYAVGDVQNALKYQRRAVKLEPHSRQIARQLAEFELAASQGAK